MPAANSRIPVCHPMKMQAAWRPWSPWSTRAASALLRALHLSQAAVTKSMRLLEDHAGTPAAGASRGVTSPKPANGCWPGRVILRRWRWRGGTRTGRWRHRHARRRTPPHALTALGEAFRWFRPALPPRGLRLSEGLMRSACCRNCPRRLAGHGGGGGRRRRHRRRRVPAPAPVVRAAVIVVRGRASRTLAPPPRAGRSRMVLAAAAGRRDAAAHRRDVRAVAGVAPTRVVCCETLKPRDDDPGITRRCGACSRTAAGAPETRGLVAIDDCPLKPFDIESWCCSLQPDASFHAGGAVLRAPAWCAARLARPAPRHRATAVQTNMSVGAAG